MNYDLITTIVMQLFILSMISERVTNFIKLNLQALTDRLGNFRIKEHTEEKEKERERGILNWAILVGVVVAFATKADLFYMIEKGALQPGWKNISWLGCILNGFFISLGSKFWHDLLDLLLEVKNLKANLNNVTEMEINKATLERVATLGGEMVIMDNPLVKKSMESHLQSFSSRGIVGYSGSTDKEGVFCEVDVKDSGFFQPQSIPLTFASGRTGSLRMITNTQASPISIHLLQPESGEEIGLLKTFNESGTLGCLVRYKITKEPVWITCYHVVKPPKQSWESYDRSKGPDEVEQPNDENITIGKIRDARRNLRMDVALIEPDMTKVELLSTIARIGEIKGFRTVTKEDENNRIQVKKSGKNTDVTHGTIEKIEYSAAIDYLDSQPLHELFDLIKIRSNSSNRPFSRPGDSGSVVLDSQNRAIGILVGGSKDGVFSYAMPISAIFNEFSLECF